MQPAVICVFCDGATEEAIRDALCLPLLSIDHISAIRTIHSDIDPMAILIDASTPAARESSWASIMAEAVIKWPHSAQIVLVGSGDDERLEKAFSTGAHDVCSKPLRPRELLARVIRRSTELGECRADQKFSFGDLLIDPRSRRISTTKMTAKMTSRSFEVLMQLITSPTAHRQSREELKRLVWKDVHVCDGAVDRQIHEIRKVLKEIGSASEVQSFYGEGYAIKVNQ